MESAIDVMKTLKIPDQEALDIQLHASREVIPFGFFDPKLFPNGFAYFIANIPQLANVTPVYIHANWANGKRSKLLRLHGIGGWSLGQAHPIPRGGPVPMPAITAMEKGMAKFHVGDLHPFGHHRAGSRRYITYMPKDERVLHLPAELENLRTLMFLSKLVNRTAIIPSYRCWAGRPDVWCPFDIFFNFDAFDKGDFSYTFGVDWHNMSQLGVDMSYVNVDSFFGDMAVLDPALGTEGIFVVDDIYRAPLSAFFESAYTSYATNHAWYNATIAYSEFLRSAYESIWMQMQTYPAFHCVYIDVNKANYGSTLVRDSLSKYVGTNEPIYIIHGDPKYPPPTSIVSITQTWGNRLNYLAWNSMWPGFQGMPGYWGLSFIQAQVCEKAKYFFILLPRMDLFAHTVCASLPRGRCIQVPYPSGIKEVALRSYPCLAQPREDSRVGVCGDG